MQRNIFVVAFLNPLKPLLSIPRSSINSRIRLRTPGRIEFVKYNDHLTEVYYVRTSIPAGMPLFPFFTRTYLLCANPAFLFNAHEAGTERYDTNCKADGALDYG